VNSIMRDLPAWGISLVVNLSLLLVLHSIVREVDQRMNPPEITSVIDQVQEREIDWSEVSATDMVGNDGDHAMLTPTMQAATAQGDNRETMKEQIEDLINPEIIDFSQMADIPMQDQLAVSFESRGQTDKVAGGVEGAMDRITAEIAASLRERQTFVIWLFDSSGSLKDRREAIAGRFENVYKQLETQGKTEGLYTAVASFAETPELLTKDPVQDVSALVDAVRKVPEQVGTENVFGAVYQVVDKWKLYRKSEGRWNKMVFIVTDERGDDIGNLEETITLCKRYGVRVYCVGNAAIFGRQEGYVDYREPDGFVHEDVPVDQGPESAFAERLMLPFWGNNRLSRDLQRMSAGYGPYGLTRLCSETGGMFFITAENKGVQFDMALMRDYAPDLRPLRTLEQEIKSNPAKSALLQAAMAGQVERVPTLQLAFRADSDTILRQQITEAQKPAADFKYHIDKLFAIMEPAQQARDSLKSPRWRASFDLAMGRLLATRVRAYGYNVMLANMKSSPKTFQTEGSNLWRLVPSDGIESGPAVRKAAEEAEKYLKRVINEHPNTPWFELARHELKQPLGWGWQEGHLDVGAVLAGDQSADPLLLLEEERRQVEQRRPAGEPTRRPPKL
jgi:hypothetical protein